MNPLERAAARSRWAKVNVGEKSLLFIGLIVLAVGLPPRAALPLIAVTVLALAIAARVPFRLYLGLVSAPWLFVVVGVIPLMVQITSHGLVYNPAGYQDAVVVLFRSLVATAAMMVFVLTTPMAEILSWASRKGFPETLMYVVVLIYRMISTMIVSSRTMWEAQAMRLGHSNRRRFIRSVADQAASLFVLSLTRARRLGEGLELRADPSAVKVSLVDRPVVPKRLAAIVLLLTVIVIVSVVAR